MKKTMRRLAAMTAASALVLGTAPAVIPAAEAETTAEAGSAAGDSRTGELHLDFSTSDGAYSISVTMDKDADGDFTAGIQGSGTGLSSDSSDASFQADDVIRYVASSQTLYVNTDAISDLYSDLTGDSSISVILTAVGVTDSWVEVPLADFAGLADLVKETKTENLQPSDTLNQAVTDALAPIGTYSDSSISLSFDNDSLIQTADNLDTVIADNKEELKSLSEQYAGAADEAQIAEKADKAVEILENGLKPYIDAYAEGYTSATGGNQEEYASSIKEELDAALQDAFSSLTESTDLEDSTGSDVSVSDLWDEMPDLSDELTSALEDISISGDVNGTWAENSLNLSVTMTFQDTAADADASQFSLSFSALYDGENLSDTGIEVPESATALTDVVKQFAALMAYSTVEDTTGADAE